MSLYEIALPAARFTATLPEEAAAGLHALFPRARPAEGGRTGDAGRHFVLSPDGEHWRLDRGGASLGRYATSGHALVAMEQRVIAALARSRPGRLALHAGAVDLGGGACLFAGPAEAGKTSSTVQLVELGAVFVADEVALVETSSARVAPFARTPAVAAGFVEEALPGRAARHGRLVEVAPSMPRYVPRRMAEGPVAVSDLILPRYSRGAGLEVVELDPGEALTEVLRCCFPPTDGLATESVVDELIALLERWSIRRLVYGDAAAARRALDGLFPRLSAAGAAP